jgi:hypothetical protein
MSLSTKECSSSDDAGGNCSFSICVLARIMVVVWIRPGFGDRLCSLWFLLVTGKL